MAVKVHLFALMTTALLVICVALPLEGEKGRQEGTVSYSGYKLFRTDVPLTQLPVVDSLDTSHGVDVWSWRYNDRSLEYELDVLTPPAAETQVTNVFTEYELNYQEVIKDLQSAINQELSEDEELFWNRPAHPMSWVKYHSVNDMYQYLDYLEDGYPQLVRVLNIGQSFENRTLKVVKVSFGPNRPAIWIDGGVHAREWISPATVLYILNRLVEFNWDGHEIISNFDWYIMPMGNPDGYEYSRLHDRLWRKTRSIDPKYPNCVGVDANRNFGYEWLTGGSSTYPCSDVYAGPSAFSEPETRAIRDFLLEKKDQLKVFLSLHAYSQMWMLPWSHTQELPENYQDMMDVAKLAVDAIKRYNGTEYSLGSITELLYVASGSSGDFAHGVAKIPYSYSLELRDLGRYGFILPKEQIEPTGLETYEGIKALVAGVYKKLYPHQEFVNEVEAINNNLVEIRAS